MRNSTIQALMTRTRSQVLAATLLHPERQWYLSDLARHLRVPPSSLQRELASLTAAGILKNRRQGRMIYFQADPNSPVYPDLRGLLLKTSGLADLLRAALERHADRIHCAFVYGSIAQGREGSLSDIDLIIVGDVSLSALAVELRHASAQLGREINPKFYRRTELATRLAAHDHFLGSVLTKRKLFVVGNADDLEKAAGRETRRAGSNRERRD